MRHLASPFALAALTAVAACGTVQSNPIPVAGPVASLAGEWRGSYESAETGRAGSIVFTLVGGEDHAHGDVIMIPRGLNAPLRPAHGFPSAAEPPMPSSQVLTIEFVQATGDSVFGSLAPYTDPECSCTVLTTFLGRLQGNTIEGTFTTRRARATMLIRGTWMVRRQG